MTKRKDKITVICRQCGMEFKAWTRTARYCEQCRTYRSREQARDYQRVRRESEKLERENLPVPPPPPKICADCGKEFDPGESRRRIYCDECARKRRRDSHRRSDGKSPERKSPKPDLKTCPVCGKKYRPTKMAQFYCTATCKHRAEEGDWSRVWPDRNPGITEAAVEAKKLGISYGQYKAMIAAKKQEASE